jgi:O-methyltransferase
MSSRAALWLDRMGLLIAARRMRHRLFPDHETLRFPTYDAGIAQRVKDSGDPARYASLALAVRTLQQEGIAGEFAEVGVYRGATSRFLAACAPERTLHLFDTFAGFDRREREPENASDERFQATSEATVRRALGATANAVIHAGHFPTTTAGLEDRTFAFVLLDLDVYAPTRAGLEFFYPRLASGGYCFVHDYNSPESNRACRRALTEFLAGKPERAIELPDTWGSAVFRKVGARS